MSLTPEPAPVEESSPQPGRGRRHRLLHICFAIFTFEIGLILLIIPWRDDWTFNYFQGSSSLLERLWDDPYFRGAISGLGLVNIYLSVLEFRRAFRRP
jgi:hypothetical protein